MKKLFKLLRKLLPQMTKIEFTQKYCDGLISPTCTGTAHYYWVGYKFYRWFGLEFKRDFKPRIDFEVENGAIRFKKSISKGVICTVKYNVGGNYEYN